MSQGHDAIYKAMADEHRRKILMTLCRESLVAGELAQLVGLAPNALSFHLKWLKSAGLVSVDREGRFLRYHANPDLLSEWARHIQSTFTASPTMRRFQQAQVTSAAAKYRENRQPEPPQDRPLHASDAGAYAWAAGADDSGRNGDDILPTELL